MREREAAPPPPQARTRRRVSNVANQANADPPPSYRASGHPATKAVMKSHMETINRLKSAGKALQQDNVDNLITYFYVYDTLPLRPNGILLCSHAELRPTSRTRTRARECVVCRFHSSSQYVCCYSQTGRRLHFP